MIQFRYSASQLLCQNIKVHLYHSFKGNLCNIFQVCKCWKMDQSFSILCITIAPFRAVSTAARIQKQLQSNLGGDGTGQTYIFCHSMCFVALCILSWQLFSLLLFDIFIEANKYRIQFIYLHRRISNYRYLFRTMKQLVTAKSIHGCICCYFFRTLFIFKNEFEIIFTIINT